MNNIALIANEIEKSIWGDNYVDIISTISVDGLNVPILTPSGKFISFDTSHVTKDGAIYLGEKLLENAVLKEAFRF